MRPHLAACKLEPMSSSTASSSAALEGWPEQWLR